MRRVRRSSAHIRRHPDALIGWGAVVCLILGVATLLLPERPSPSAKSAAGLTGNVTVPHPPHGAASAQRWELLDLPHPSFISRAGAADLGTKIADVIRTTRDAAVSHAHDQRSVPSVLPVSLAKGWVSSEFGMRIHPISGKRRMHAGIDLAVDEGTPVIATADGTVLFAQRNGGYGFLLKIDHRNGIQTWYAHNCRLLVKAGQPVARGDRIALSGETGYTTGEHLHYEVRVDGKPVEPRLFLPRVIVEGGKRTASRVGDSSRH